MIQDQRKTNLNSLAAFIAEEHHKAYVTDLAKIADSEGIFVYYDRYEDAFDGMLVCDEDGLFHIHINLDRGNTPDSKRGRFTFAHELSHYFIEEHREPLRTGKIAPHGSLHDFEHNDDIEEEADYFAGCLLMPEKQLRAAPKSRKFSIDTIIQLADLFQTSVLSTIIRFAEVGTHSMCSVISKNNIMKWYVKSKDFPDWPFRTKVHRPLPPTTVAGEFFTKTDAKYTDVENIDQDDWFFSKWTIKYQWHEQCYYSDSFGYVISLIWYD